MTVGTDVLTLNADDYTSNLSRLPETGFYYDKMTGGNYSTKYVRSTATAASAYLGYLSNTTISGKRILGITVEIQAKINAGGFNITLECGLYKVGVGASFNTVKPNVSYLELTYSYKWSINPFTSLPFTTADLDAFGLYLRTSTFPSIAVYMRIIDCRLKVHYDDFDEITTILESSGKLTTTLSSNQHLTGTLASSEKLTTTLEAY